MLLSLLSLFLCASLPKGRGEPGRRKQGGVHPVGAGLVVGKPGAEPVPEDMPQYTDEGEGRPSEAGEPGTLVLPLWWELLSRLLPNR